MKYILNSSGFIEEISFGGLIECNSNTCITYEGTAPTGYTSLEEWANNANIRAYNIVSGNLTYNATEDARLQAEWAKQSAHNIITASPTNSITFTNTSNTKNILAAQTQIGDKLSISDGGVLIGSGVSFIKAGGQLTFTTGFTSGDVVGIDIYLNTTQISYSRFRTPGAYFSVVLQEKLIPVQQGDIVYLYCKNQTGGRGNRIDGDTGNYLTVEVVE